MFHKPYIRFFEREDDKYYDVTIDNPETGNTIQLMTALDYPEDSKVYQKAVEIKDYLDKNEGKGLDKEDTEKTLDDSDKEMGEIDTQLKAILSSDKIDNEKKKEVQAKIKKAEDIRKNLTIYRNNIQKKISELEKEIDIAKAAKATEKEEPVKKQESIFREVKKKPKEPVKEDPIEKLEIAKNDLEDMLSRVKEKLDGITKKIRTFTQSLTNLTMDKKK
jgi:chromosome segregation ATPase